MRETFDKFVLAAKKYGRVTVYAQKTRIVFQGRVRFGGAVVKQDWLEGRIWLKRRIEHPHLIRVESYGNLGYGLHFKLQNPNDIDKSLVELMGEAFAIGQQD